MCIQQTATTYVTTATTKLTHLLENENNASSSPSSGEATSALAYTGWPKKLGHIGCLQLQCHIRQGWCCLQVKLCDPCLSALRTRCLSSKALYKSTYLYFFYFLPSIEWYEVGTLAIDGWAVAVGTARRRIGRAQLARAPPRCTTHQRPVYQSPYCCIMFRCSRL